MHGNEITWYSLLLFLTQLCEHFIGESVFIVVRSGKAVPTEAEGKASGQKCLRGLGGAVLRET